MSESPVATSPAPGGMGVSWERRVDSEPLHGVVLLGKTLSIRHVAPTQTGIRSVNEVERWALVTKTRS